MKKRLASILGLVLILALVGCNVTPPNPNQTSQSTTAEIPTDVTTPEETTPGCSEPPFTPPVPAEMKKAEYNMAVTTMPYNWNLLTNQSDTNDQIIKYVHSALFEYDYKFDGNKYNADGSINASAIVAGDYTVNYSAATKLEDVTALVDAKWGYTAEQIAQGGYAWKITLRDDLKWDDGTPITAADFVYSMQAQLDPYFMNANGKTYYDVLGIKNARAYFIQDQDATFESVKSFGYASIEDAIAAGKVIYVDAWALWGSKWYRDNDGNTCPQWLAISDETIYYSGDYHDYISGKLLWSYVEGLLPSDSPYAGIFVQNYLRDVKWEDVGFYTDGDAIVMCLDNSFDFLMEDGSLSYLAVEYLANLPLVKRELYEANKCQPSQWESLWTSDYNSNLESSASWGPYKLVSFDGLSGYRLEKNVHWYGWNMEEYKNQYNITAINCYNVEQRDDELTGFLAGKYDEAELSSANLAKYYTSKYVVHTPTTGVYGLQIYANLDVLKNSENNNGILAIKEFREALSLALDRSDVVEKVWPGSSAVCFGIITPLYYYNVQNGGIYRNTNEAKAALLRAYGYTQQEDGTWSIGDLCHLSLEEAYESITGYNPVLAKEKLREAITILNANADYYGYDAEQTITLVYGASIGDETNRARMQYLQDVIDDLTAGTALENKILLSFSAFGISSWADVFRSGKAQIGFLYGYKGDALNPHKILGFMIDPASDSNYHPYWDTSAIDLTITLPAGDYECAGTTITMSALNWYFCLMGLASENGQAFTYNWDADHAPDEVRLAIFAALEELILSENLSIMTMSGEVCSMMSAKVSYITDEYNVFMEFGGLRYMVVNYTDVEWNTFVRENNNDLSDLYIQTN